MRQSLAPLLLALTAIQPSAIAKVPPTTIDRSLGSLGWSKGSANWRALLRRQPLDLFGETVTCGVKSCDLPPTEEVVTAYSAFDPAVKAYVKHEYVKTRKLLSIELRYDFEWEGLGGIYYSSADENDDGGHDPSSAICKYKFSHHFDVHSIDYSDNIVGFKFYFFEKEREVDFYHDTFNSEPPTPLSLFGNVEDKVTDPKFLKRFDDVLHVVFDNLVEVDTYSSRTKDGKDTCDASATSSPTASGTISFNYSVKKVWRKTLYLK